MTMLISTGTQNMLFGSTVAGNNKTFKDQFEAGVMYVYGGSKPINPDKAVGAATLLGIATKNGGAFVWGNPTNGIEWTNGGENTPGVIELAAGFVLQFTGLADGVATWARLMGNAEDLLGDSTVLPRMDITVGSTQGDLIISPSNQIVTSSVYTCTLGQVSWNPTNT